MTVKRMTVDYQRQADACKRKHLVDSSGKPLRRYHYLFFIATDFPARGKGLASQVVAKYQSQAAIDGLPIWLEASSEHSRNIYARLGFKVLQTLCFGKGTHGTDGLYQRGGPGVTIWAMCWWPPSKEAGNLDSGNDSGKDE